MQCRVALSNPFATCVFSPCILTVLSDCSPLNLCPGVTAAHAGMFTSAAYSMMLECLLVFNSTTNHTVLASLSPSLFSLGAIQCQLLHSVRPMGTASGLPLSPSGNKQGSISSATGPMVKCYLVPAFCTRRRSCLSTPLLEHSCTLERIRSK